MVVCGVLTALLLASRSRALPRHHLCVSSTSVTLPTSLLTLPSSVHQLLPWRCWCPSRLRHRKACNIRERNTVAEGATRPRRLKHRHHARRKQERFEAPAGSAYRGGEGIRRYVARSLVQLIKILSMLCYTQRRTDCRSSKRRRWTPRTSKAPSKPSSPVRSFIRISAASR